MFLMNTMMQRMSLPDKQPLFLILNFYKLSHVQKDTLLPTTKFNQEALHVHSCVAL